MQRKILFWAAGENAKNIYSCLRENVLVEAFVENNALRWGEEFCGKEIIPYTRMEEFTYEKVVITTPNYEQILTQLSEIGVENDKIITPFAPDRVGREGWRDIFYVGELLYFITVQRMQGMKYVLDNQIYECVDAVKRDTLQYPIIRSVTDTVQKLMDGYSMSRYGDGELNMILGRNFSTFQDTDPGLIQRLREILESSCEKHIVCLPDIYGTFINRNREFQNWFRRHLSDGGREEDYRLLDMHKVYYNAFVTRPYIDYVDKSGAGNVFKAIKAVWNDKDITIIEGSKTRFGVGNDLLDNVRSCQRILCPDVNAFQKYAEILEQAKKVDHNRIVLIALGQTATVLAYDLATEGYQALDIGHLDIEYEWYLRNVSEKVAIENKFVNEAPLGRDVSEYIENKKYHDEVVAEVG